MRFEKNITDKKWGLLNKRRPLYWGIYSLFQKGKLALRHFAEWVPIRARDLKF